MENNSKALVCSLLLILILISNYSFSQSYNHQNDDIIKKVFERNINSDIFKDTSGAIIFKVSRVAGGAITVVHIFTSDTNANISTLNVYNKLNEFENSRFFLPSFNLIVPVTFLFCGDKNINVTKENEEKVAEKIKGLKENGLLIINKPICIIQYGYTKHIDYTN